MSPSTLRTKTTTFLNDPWEFTPPQPYLLEKSMTTKYRIVDFQNKPLGDWTSDRAHLDAYIAEREPELGKQRVQSTDEIQFRFQSREEFIKGVNAQVEYELAMMADYNEEQFEKAAECAATQHDPNIFRFCGSERTILRKKAAADASNRTHNQ